MIPPNFPFNGMSGGPALRVFGGPVSPSFQLAGVIHEGSASFACIDFHRLDTLQPDGNFHRMRGRADRNLNEFCRHHVEAPKRRLASPVKNGGGHFRPIRKVPGRW